MTTGSLTARDVLAAEALIGALHHAERDNAAAFKQQLLAADRSTLFAVTAFAVLAINTAADLDESPDDANVIRRRFRAQIASSPAVVSGQEQDND